MLVIFKILGLIFVGLGILGVFLPLVPTTPFLLLALFFFARSSPQLKQRILEHRILGPYVRAYYDKNEIMGLREKITSITLQWVLILLSIYFFIDKLWVEVMLICISTAVSIHIAMLGCWGSRDSKNRNPKR